jgi:hypothetical protein
MLDRIARVLMADLGRKEMLKLPRLHLIVLALMHFWQMSYCIQSAMLSGTIDVAIFDGSCDEELADKKDAIYTLQVSLLAVSP